VYGRLKNLDRPSGRPKKPNRPADGSTGTARQKKGTSSQDVRQKRGKEDPIRKERAATRAPGKKINKEGYRPP